MSTLSPRERAEQIEGDYRKAILRMERPELVDLVEQAILSFQLAQATPEPCKEHPKYGGQRKPRTMCEGCWRYFIRRNL